MAFVVTAGQIQSVETAPSGYFAGTAQPNWVQLSATLSQTYEQIWRAQPAVRTVVGFLARNVAQLPLDVFARLDADDRKKASDHPLARLLERPVPGTKWTKYRLLNSLVHDLGVFDAAYWLKMRSDDGRVRGLLPIPYRMVRMYGGNWYAAEKYRLYGNRGYIDVDPSEIVHFHGYNPDDPRQGVSPIETLRQILAEEYAAASYREQMWRNGARVAGVIKRPKEAGKWSPEARDRFKLDWQGLYTGSGSAAGGTPILEDGMVFEPSGVTPKDAQYVESRKLTREEVAVTYFVNPVMLGIMDSEAISTVKELHKMLYQDTLPPMLTQISQDIECQLLEDIDPTSADGSVYVEFNISEKLRGSFEEQASAIQSSVGGPWMLRSEARAMFNFPAVDGADELIVPMNVTTGGLASPNDTAPDNPDNGPSNGQPPKDGMRGVLRRHYERQAKCVLSKVGARKGAHANAVVLDEGRWNAELARALLPLSDGSPAAAAHVANVAAGVNAATKAALTGALGAADPVAAVRRVFEDLTASGAVETWVEMETSR